jgi:hypothetical protein
VVSWEQDFLDKKEKASACGRDKGDNMTRYRCRYCGEFTGYKWRWLDRLRPLVTFHECGGKGRGKGLHLPTIF